MASTALIKFTQNAVAGTAGRAYFGATGLAVTVDNDVNTGVASWQIDLVYVPTGSALSTGTLAFNNNSATPTVNFTPDVPGAYRLVLSVWGAINRVGTATDIDIRNFGVKDANGFYRPAPQIWPRPLPPTSSGETGNKPDENNFGGQANGWVGDGTDGLLDHRLLYPTRADAIRELGGPTVMVAATIADGKVFQRSGTQITGVFVPGAIAAGTQTGVSGTFVFANSNNLTFGMSGSTQITGSIPAGATATGNFGALAAGTQTATSGTVAFVNSNGITFGMSGSTQITASYTVPSTAGLISAVNLSAGTTSSNLVSAVFSNSNNVSFGMNGATITATVTVPAQTNQTVGLYALGNTTQNSSTTLDARTISFNGLGMVTVGYAGGSVQISATQTVQTQSNVQGISAGTQVGRTGDISFANSNGVTFGMSGSNTVTASHAINVSGGTTSNLLSAITFNDANGVSFGLAGSVMTASVAGAAAGIAAVIAGTQTKTSGTLSFSNVNGVSFGLAGSNTITASVAAQTNQTIGLYVLGNTTQNSSTTLDARTLSFNALGGMTMGYNNGSIQASAPGTSSLSATGALSISVNGVTVSIGVPVRNVSYLNFPDPPWNTNFSISNASFSLQHFNPRADITASQANLLMALAGNTNSTGALTISMGLYTMSGSTMSLASSDSRQISWTSGSQTTNSTVYGGISGTRYRTVSLGNWAISAGDYMLGMWYRTTNDGTWRAFGYQGPTIVGAVDGNETNQYFPGFSTSSFTTAMIGSINVTNTNFVRTGGDALQQPGVIFLGSF